jgi:hypothetical protein
MVWQALVPMRDVPEASAQAKQMEAPMLFEKVAVGHRRHTVAPGKGAYIPMGQEGHTLE